MNRLLGAAPALRDANILDPLPNCSNRATLDFDIPTFCVILGLLLARNGPFGFIARQIICTPVSIFAQSSRRVQDLCPLAILNSLSHYSSVMVFPFLSQSRLFIFFSE